VQYTHTHREKREKDDEEKPAASVA